MPREQELRTIASAPREDQAAVWKKLKPKKGEGAIWWKIAQALEKTRFFARDAKFGEDERAAFGIVWQEDLFAEGRRGQSLHRRRRSLHVRSARLARRQYAEERRLAGDRRVRPGETAAKGAANMDQAEEGRPDRLRDPILATGPSMKSSSACPNRKQRKARLAQPTAMSNEAPTPKKTRPEITHKGTEIIGALRTEALVKSLEVNAVDDATLIGLLILALNARNVSIQTHGSGHATRTKLVQSITEGGRLSHDVERLRVVARQTLANVLSCSLGHGDSGLPARIAGDAIGADAHLGNMATEEFLSCLSKTAIERVGSSLNVLPRQRVKDTRAAVIAEAAGSTYIHPAALFALSQAEIAHHSEAPRDYSWGYRRHRRRIGRDDRGSGWSLWSGG